MYTARELNDLEACVARKLASSLYLAFNGKSAATGGGRAPPSLPRPPPLPQNTLGQYNCTLAFSAMPVTHQDSCSYDNHHGRAFDSVTQSRGPALDRARAHLIPPSNHRDPDSNMADSR